MTKSLILTLLVAGAAAAQDCPVQVTNVIRWSPGSGNSKLELSFKNTSDKEITTANFVVSILDSAGQPHPLMARFESGKVKAGGKKTINNWMDRESLDPVTIFKYQAGPHTVQFADGTSWNDEGGGACVWTKK
jgi:hypothetical protein